MKNATRVLAACAALVLLLVGQAYAGDAVKASVAIPSGQPTAVITENGNAYSQGTYAVGKVQLLYTVNAYSFPVGDFATFNLSMGIETNYSSGNATDYSTTLTLEQIGGEAVVLTPDVGSFSVPGTAWSAATPVRVAIPAGAPSADGTMLVGNLRLSAPGKDHLDNVTNVLVKILLVHPTDCVHLYHFITDESFSTILTTTQVNVNKSRITSTNPFGQFSDNVLVVNSCAVDQPFDLGVQLDPLFSTSPSNDVGNAVFTFSTAGAIDPDSFAIGAFGAGTSHRQSLCLQNMTVAAGDTFLATVHMGINKGSAAPTTGGTFTFGAELFGPGTSCAGTFGQAVAPANPATATLGFTLK